MLEECTGRRSRHRGRDIKSGLVVFFTVVKLTDLNERTALGFAVQESGLNFEAWYAQDKEGIKKIAQDFLV